MGRIFIHQKKKKGNQELENWLATQLNPRIDFNILEFNYNDLHFAIFKIEPTKNTPVNFKGIPYIRIGSYKKQLADHPEKERKIWTRNSKYLFEKEIIKKRITEDDVLLLIDFEGYFKLADILMPNNTKGILNRLLQDNIITKSGNKYNITNLGGLFFARNLENFEGLGRKALRVIFYNGKNRIKTIKEQIGQRGYAIGFEGLINYLSENLPSNEVIDKALRTTVTLYPIIAIRELVANAIIHQDLSIQGSSPMVEIFSNRIEITNQGKPLIDPLRFVDHSPISRNEILARTMRKLKICEERGSGIDKVVFECEFNQLPAPEIIVGKSYTRVILYGHKSLREMDKIDKTRACYLHACLKYVSGEYMTNQSLRERFGIEEKNYPMASRIINDTIKNGLVKDYDPENKSKKYAKYVPYWF